MSFRLFFADGSLKELPRGREFYNTQDTTLRKKLSWMLPLGGKHGYDVVDWMANISVKALHAEFLKRIDKQPNNFELVRACAEEDFGNLVRVLDGQDAQRVKHDLPKGIEIQSRKNKYTSPIIARVTTKALPEEITHIVAPGLGGIYNALMAKATRGIDYTLCNLSRFHGNSEEENFFHPDDIGKFPNEPGKLVVFDGYIARGRTLRMASKYLNQVGLSPLTGGSVVEVDSEAIKYDTEDFDFVSPIRGCRKKDIKDSLYMRSNPSEYCKQIEQEINKGYQEHLDNSCEVE